jgi:hypothetical protein
MMVVFYAEVVLYHGFVENADAEILNTKSEKSRDA